MPGRMKKHLEQIKEVASTQTKSEFGAHIFESLMVFGPDKHQLAESCDAAMSSKGGGADTGSAEGPL